MKPQAYLAGPMTGILDYNFDEFEYFRKKLDQAGWHVITPFDTNNRVWQKHYGRMFNPREDKCNYGDSILREMFVLNIETLLDSKAMFVLPNADGSTGVRIEKSVADAFSIPIFNAEDYIAAV